MPEKTKLDIRPGMKIYYFISRSSKLWKQESKAEYLNDA